MTDENYGLKIKTQNNLKFMLFYIQVFPD